MKQITVRNHGYKKQINEVVFFIYKREYYLNSALRISQFNAGMIECMIA